MRLDHLLSKEPTARFGHVRCPVAGKFLRRALAYGCHEIPSTPAHQPAELSGAFGRAVAGTTEPSGARPSLLCFEEAAFEPPGPASGGSGCLLSQAERATPPSSSAPDPSYRRLETHVVSAASLRTA